MRKYFLLILLFFLFPLFFVPAQNTDEDFYQALNEAFAVNITSRVYNVEDELVWDFETTKVTFLGRAVTIRINGNNLTVMAHLTPYREEGDDYLLVAQGQVWIATDGEEGVKYLSTVKSIPIKLGERIIFLPLGVDYRKEAFTIELDVQLAAYSSEDASL